MCQPAVCTSSQIVPRYMYNERHYMMYVGPTTSLRSMEEAIREVSVTWPTIVSTFSKSSSGMACMLDDSSRLMRTWGEGRRDEGRGRERGMVGVRGALIVKWGGGGGGVFPDLGVEEEHTLCSFRLLDVVHYICDVQAALCRLCAELSRAILRQELVTLRGDTNHSDSLLRKHGTLHTLNNEHFISKKRDFSIITLPGLHYSHYLWHLRLC